MTTQPKPATQLQEQLTKWSGINIPKQHDYNRHYKGKHALRPYVACVEFPLSRGGGVAWFKSATTVKQYEAKGYSVVWLDR
jgi:hypothetical protein